MTELKQINIFDTVFQFAENYDPDIKKIRVYGILDKNNHCINPLFHASDVIKYLKGTLNNDTYHIKKFKNPKEMVKIKVSQTNKDPPNLLTKYGLIRAIGLCCNDTSKASIAFREFIYALFDALENGHTNKGYMYSAFYSTMETPNIQAELNQSEANKTGGIVYFIKNLTTRNIKIGRTDGDIETRLLNLQTANDCKLAVVKTIACDSRVVEARLHEQFAEYHIRGEWYCINDVQINQINQISRI
jgi:hypothetical protein